MDVFDLFVPQELKFIKLRSTVAGNQEGEDFTCIGVVKQREGIAQDTEQDTRTGDATVYIKPGNPFVEATGGSMVGHLVRITTDDLPEQLHRIISSSEGKDFDTNEVRHYRLDTKKIEATKWAQSSVLT